MMKKENYLLELYSSKEIFTILDSIDFYSEYDIIFPKLSNFLVFLAISNSNVSFHSLTVESFKEKKFTKSEFNLLESFDDEKIFTSKPENDITQDL
ncbi:MAG: hypothetical protein LBD88_01905 [Candidatus Peribacteria bacterium]|jgi:hypothetical protein|nr:hypothetical protein [Candidatus Peribacteria bacterium]